jgi:D-alanyl-lipoteichoic acid acyltransferase DltB (MBOAT superfamily)
MIFNSLTYLVLLTVVVGLYWVLPTRPRLLLVFFASLTFYGFWRIEFLPVMLLSVVVDYIVGLSMPGKVKRTKKKLLLVSLFVNLGLLFYFKYLIFFAENAVGFAHLLGFEVDDIALKIVLPLGISFYTFQTISYTVDVYRGFIKPERDFVLYACYVTFFPQLVAGPILRAAEVIHQFAQRPPFDSADLAIGARRIVYGLFLKVALADNIAPLVDTGFATPVEVLSALDVWTLAFLFGFQIYFDFSAYSHIALGSARLMGICFPENFNFPYLATSPKDFWRRWHISLSSWIRDYLYLPLAGIKVHDRSVGGLGNATLDKKKNKSLFITWAVMGLWHGANWTFVLWGAYHSVVIFLYRLFEPHTRSVGKAIKTVGGIAITLPIVMLAWIPFRADSLGTTFAMWSKLLNPFAYAFLGMRENTYIVTAAILMGVFSTYAFKNKLVPVLSQRSALVVGESVGFSIMILIVIVFLRPINQFIYFQF